MTIPANINFYFRTFCLTASLFLISYSYSFGQEVCDNALDDDLDGLIDLNDDDCICEIVEVKSLIYNPSFEEMVCCPDDKTELECATSWRQASGPTTDYIHNCGWGGWPEFPPPIPFPDGDGIIGFRDGNQEPGLPVELFWKEYAGACLLSPMQAGENYSLVFNLGFVDATKSPPIEITLYGSRSCNNLPFGGLDVDIGCPINEPGWEVLSSKLVVGGNGNIWVKDTLRFTPSDDILSIVFGPPCTETSSDQSTYYFLDNLKLAHTESFDFELSEINHPCEMDFMISVPKITDHEYQWYQNGLALQDQTNHELQINKVESVYRVRIMNDRECFLSQEYIYNAPVLKTFIDDFICIGEPYIFGNQMIYEQGTYIDTIKRENKCDSIVSINLFLLESIQSEDSIKIFMGQSYEIDGLVFSKAGNYTYMLPSITGCDSVINLTIEYFELFYANIFSPNDDGINDTFAVSGDLSLVVSVELLILDRWGNLLYRGAEWDGAYNGNKVTPGVYTFISRVIMVNGNEMTDSGTITVVR